MKKTIIIIVIFLVVVLIIEVTLLSKGIPKLEENKTAIDNAISNIGIENNIINNKIESEKQVVENDIKMETAINEWNLKLVNYENSLPSDFVPQLSFIDNTRQFDIRAIGELKKMIGDMKKDKISDIWVQSSYRSIEQQQKIFNKKIDEYIKKRKIT